MDGAWAATLDELVGRVLAEATEDLVEDCLAVAERCDPEDDEAVAFCVDRMLGLAEGFWETYGAEAAAGPVVVAVNTTLAAFAATGSPEHPVALAKTLHRIGLSQYAITVLDHALTYDGPDAHTGAPPPSARLHAERGELLRRLGALDDADVSLRAALDGLDGGETETQLLRSSVLNNLGLVRHNQGDLVQAKEFLVEALVIDERVGENQLTTAITLDNLGVIEAQRAHEAGPLWLSGDFVNAVVSQHLDEADGYHEQAGQIFAAELPDSAEHYVISLVNRVDIANQRRDRRTEDELSSRALDLAERSEVPEVAYLHAVSVRGEVLNRHGRHQEAVEHLTPWLERVLTSSPPHERPLRGLTALLSASAWAGGPELTERVGRALMDTDNALIEVQLAGAPASSARAIFADHARHTEMIIGHCLPAEQTGVAPRWLYDLLLNRKGVLAERQGSAWLRARTDDELFDTLRRLRTEVARIDLDGSGEASITAARRRHAEAAGELADAERWLYRQLGGQWLLPVTTRDVQERLAPDTTLLDLAVVRVRTGRLHYVLFVVPPAGEVRYRHLGTVAELDERIRELTALVSRPGSAPQDWPALVDPAEQLTRNLVVAPTGRWGMVPLSLLAGDHVVSTVPSGRWLVTRAPADDVAPGEPLVLGDPDFDLWGDEEVPYLLSMRMPRLAGAGAELADVAARLGVTAVVGGDATRGRLLATRRPRVLHIATHGTFLDAIGSMAEQSEPRTWTSRSVAGAVVSVDEDALGFSRTDQPTDARTRHRTRVRWLREIGPADQLSRSGLLLSGFNAWLAGVETSADVGVGMLSAGEFALLDLAGTELVVLSACETGVGAVDAADGSLIGLRTAALAAGARACVSSLWKVDDASTAELMSLFYGELAAGKPPRDALHEAQTAHRQNYPDPHHWAAWTIDG